MDRALDWVALGVAVGKDVVVEDEVLFLPADLKAYVH